jgi:nucleoside-diphosphate-sugar epimerase
LCQQFAREHGVPAVVLRLFTVYGPWEGATRFVPAVMLAALDRRPLAVTEGGLAHDWIFVDDVVDACVRSVSVPGITGDILNIATGRQTTNEQIVRLVEELDGAAIPRLAARSRRGRTRPRGWPTSPTPLNGSGGGPRRT